MGLMGLMGLMAARYKFNSSIIFLEPNRNCISHKAQGEHTAEHDAGGKKL